MLQLILGSLALLLAAGSALGAGIGGQEAHRQQTALSNSSITHSFNVSTCSGYILRDLSETQNGLTAKLDLAGPACNAFGADIANLTVQVTYETQSRYASANSPVSWIFKQRKAACEHLRHCEFAVHSP
jgi:alpha-glucosidase